jgi:hypothetical protein
MSVDQLQTIALIGLSIAQLMHLYSHRRPL